MWCKQWWPPISATIFRSPLVLVVLCVLSQLFSTVTAADGSVLQFKVTPENYFSKGLQYYRVLRLDKDANTLYVGAMNHLYRLWMHNINNTENKAFYAETHLPSTKSAEQRCQYRSKNVKYHCQNHIRVIFKLEESVYVCSTNAYDPIVSLLEVDDMKLKKTESGLAICPVDPDDNGTAVYVAQGNPGNIPSVYSGSVTDSTQSVKVIYRPPLFDQAGNTKHSFMRTMHTDSKSLNDPNFVGSFEIGEYVYFFFREVALETSSFARSVFSRVARICKNDKGGQNVLQQNWATFLKARLNCSIDGEMPFYFDEIQSVQNVDVAGETYFFAVFTTALNGFYGSAVCAYSLQDINLVFDTGNFKEQISNQHAWSSVHESQVPSPRPGQCVPDTLKISDSNLNFVKSRWLMNSAVPMLGHKFPLYDQSHEPVFYRRDVIFTRVTVDQLTISGTPFLVVFAGTSTGSVYKILVWFPEPGAIESSLLSVFQLQTAETVRALQVLSNEFLFVAQDVGVSQVTPHQCSHYKLCKSCTSDPYCAWNVGRAGCFNAQDARSSSGWLLFSPTKPREGAACPLATKRLSRMLYPGDSVYFDCPRPPGSEAVWQYNNKSLETPAGGRLLQTTDNGLVFVSVDKNDGGFYDCISEGQTVVSYQVYVDDVNCKKPHNAEAYQSVYREWCREFQEYKGTMLRYKKQLEESQVQCINSQNRNSNRIAAFDGLSMKLTAAEGSSGFSNDITMR